MLLPETRWIFCVFFYFLTFSKCVHAFRVISVLSDSCDMMHPQAPLSVSFSRREYWSGGPGSPPGDLPTRRLIRVPASPHRQAASLPLVPAGKPSFLPSSSYFYISIQKFHFNTYLIHMFQSHCTCVSALRAVVCVCSVNKQCPTLATPWTAVYHACLSSATSGHLL